MKGGTQKLVHVIAGVLAAAGGFVETNEEGVTGSTGVPQDAVPARGRNSSAPAVHRVLTANMARKQEADSQKERALAAHSLVNIPALDASRTAAGKFVERSTGRVKGAKPSPLDNITPPRGLRPSGGAFFVPTQHHPPCRAIWCGRRSPVDEDGGRDE